MRPLPDPDLSLRDACDFIFESPLARRALEAPEPSDLANFLRELIHEIYRLAQSCHLAEFTDHGLGHLCSLIDRLSQWSMAKRRGKIPRVVERPDFDPTQAAVLLLATLLHDLGMLSQRPEDMPNSGPDNNSLLREDVSVWVRKTHVLRLEKLAHRLFAKIPYAKQIRNHSVMNRAISVATAHGSWPWEWKSFKFQDAGLAAMLAVADLLDEDYRRCDSPTLLKHRYAEPLSCAHWMRHGLTVGRVLVNGGRIKISMARPPGTSEQMAPVFLALRNHYNLVMLYNDKLAVVNAQILSVSFSPKPGSPLPTSPSLDGWSDIPEFGTESALVYHLLDSFMPEALLNRRRIDPGPQKRLKQIGIKEVDLHCFDAVRGTTPPRTSIERNFHALLNKR